MFILKVMQIDLFLYKNELILSISLYLEYAICSFALSNRHTPSAQGTPESHIQHVSWNVFLNQTEMLLNRKHCCAESESMKCMSLVNTKVCAHQMWVCHLFILPSLNSTGSDCGWKTFVHSHWKDIVFAEDQDLSSSPVACFNSVVLFYQIKYLH